MYMDDGLINFAINVFKVGKWIALVKVTIENF